MPFRASLEATGTAPPMLLDTVPGILPLKDSGRDLAVVVGIRT